MSGVLKEVSLVFTSKTISVRHLGTMMTHIPSNTGRAGVLEIRRFWEGLRYNLWSLNMSPASTQALHKISSHRNEHRKNIPSECK